MRKRLIIGVAIVASGLSGGSLAAGAYPPDGTPGDTVFTSDQPTPAQSARPPAALRTAADLPATGSDPGSMVMIAGGAIVAGAGLLVVTRRRSQLAR